MVAHYRWRWPSIEPAMCRPPCQPSRREELTVVILWPNKRLLSQQQTNINKKTDSEQFCRAKPKGSSITANFTVTAFLLGNCSFFSPAAVPARAPARAARKSGVNRSYGRCGAGHNTAITPAIPAKRCMVDKRPNWRLFLQWLARQQTRDLSPMLVQCWPNVELMSHDSAVA